jgi:hypothetical protein
MKIRTTALILGVALALTGCTAEGTPQIEAAPTEAAEASDAPTAEVTSSPASTPAPPQKAQRGSRENPLGKGEARRISDESAFTVSFGETEDYGNCIGVPVTAQVDWKNLQQQYEDTGTPADAPATPFLSLSFAFVSKSGESYTDFGDCGAAPIDEAHFMADDMYPPKDQDTAIYYVEVPKGGRNGGLWEVSNSINERVFGAQY